MQVVVATVEVGRTGATEDTETGGATTVAGTIGVAMTGVLHVSACSLSSTWAAIAHSALRTRILPSTSAAWNCSAQLCFMQHCQFQAPASLFGQIGGVRVNQQRAQVAQLASEHGPDTVCAL
jgi:hypothetical protein